MYEKGAMENVNYTFQYTSNADTRQALQFTAAHALNTVYEMNQNCTANGLNLIPDNINLWVTTSNWFTSSTTPMLQKVFEPVLNQQYINLFLNPPRTMPGALFRALKIILLKYAPDVVITVNNDSQNGPAKVAHEISSVTFHELGHAVHYSKVGRTYWLNVISTYIANGGYGSKNNLTAVVESWGYFIGPTYNANKYNVSYPVLADEERRGLENQKYDGNVPHEYYGGTYSYGWIPWGAVHDLTDSTEPAGTLITDNVSGYTINGVFKGYTSSSTTVEGLKAAILSNNGNSQSTQVNTLVTSYGW